MSAYQHFAYYYDDVFQNLDYSLWLKFIEPYLKDSSSILDLACGSGTFTILLKLKGYEVEGMDLSSSIIEIAKEKAKMNHLLIPYYVADMTHFQFSKQYDVITCFFDSINFLKTKEEIQSLLFCASAHLKTNGFFICDIFSKKLLKEYKHHHFKKTYATHKLKWHTKLEDNLVKHIIQIQEGNLKYKEIYNEYFYEINDIIHPDFQLIQVAGDFKEDFTDEDERVLLVLQKK